MNVLRVYLILPILMLAGCAHLFVQSNTTAINSKSEPPLSVICIRKGDSLQNSQIVDANDKWFGKSFTKKISKFNTIKIDCSSPDVFNFLINLNEKEEFGVYWFFSLGIIPSVYTNNLNIKLFDLNNKTIFEKNVVTKNVISIVFLPLFFLNNDIAETAFDEIENCLQEQLKFSNKPI